MLSRDAKRYKRISLVRIPLHTLFHLHYREAVEHRTTIT